MGRVTYFSVMKEWTREIHWQLYRMGWESPPSSENCDRPTLAPPSPRMQMTLGRAAPLGGSGDILTTWWWDAPCAVTYLSRPRAYWPCLPGTSQGRSLSSGDMGSRSWWVDVTSGDSWDQRRRRISGWGRKWEAGEIQWPPWLKWRVRTGIPHMQACRSPSRKSGTSCNASPGHRDGLPGGRGCVAGHLTTGPLSGGHE